MPAPRTGPDGETLRLAGIAYLAGAPQFIGNVVPLLLGAIADSVHATPVQLGTVNSCFTALSLVATASAPWWVGRVHRRVVTLVAAIVVCGLFLASPLATSIGAFYVLFALVGLLAGVLGAPANAALGHLADPARWWSLSMAFQMVVAAAYSVLVTALLQPRFGPLVALSATALIFAPCVLAAAFAGTRMDRPAAAPAHPAAGAPRAQGTPATASGWPLAAAFCGSMFFALGGVSYWIFIERMARAASVGTEVVGVAIGVATIAAAVSASLAASLSRNLRLVLVIGAVAAVIGFGAMLRPGAIAVFVSACLFNVGWGMLVPAFQSVIRGADAGDRLYVAGPATIFLGAVAAGPLGGAVAQAFGYPAVMYLSIGATLLALVLGLAAHAGSLPLQQRFSGLVRASH